MHQLVNKTSDLQIVLLDVLAGLRPGATLAACLDIPALSFHKISAKLPRSFNYLHLHIFSLTYYFLLSSHRLSFFFSLCLLLHSLPYPLISFSEGGGYNFPLE